MFRAFKFLDGASGLNVEVLHGANGLNVDMIETTAAGSFRLLRVAFISKLYPQVMYDTVFD